MAATTKARKRSSAGRTSLRAFATSIGVSHTAVQAAIRNGRLRKSIGRDARGPFVRDVVLAKREWAAGASKPANDGGRKARTGVAERRAAVGPAGTLVDAQVRVASERATGLELANRRERGELLDAATVEREYFEVARMLRERILNVPDRLADLGPVVRARLRAELRQALGDHADEVVRG